MNDFGVIELNRINAQIAHNLKRTRKACGLSMTDVATRVGLSYQQIQKYENGTDHIRASRLYQLSKIYKKPVSEFFKF